jgi:hypothetical protein
MDTLVSLCKRRGFIFPSSEIYGGFGSTWDYGPLGVELKRNIREAWWRAMVRERDDIVGLDASLLTNPRAAVRAATAADVPLLYWTAAAWAAAISLSKDNPELVAQIPAMEALMDRALELDDGYGRGAIHTFLITYEMSRQGAAGDPAARARAHFERAMALAEGTSAAPLVALAEAVAVRQQDVKEFESLLNRVLALNPDAHPDTRLLNLIMQRRARWLLSRKADLFLIEEE